MKTDVTLRSVIWNGRQIEYILARKQVKNINIRVKDNGIINVSAGRRVPLSFVDDLVLQKAPFIVEALDKYARRAAMNPVPEKYVSGESIMFLGKRKTLSVVQTDMPGVTVSDDRIIIGVKDPKDQELRKKVLNKWLLEREKELYDELCRATYDILKIPGLEYPVIKIRTMKSRWGSCHTTKGVITLNSSLIEKPVEAIQYVVLHEFAHFVHPDHSRQFYSYIETYMPDWKERKAKLN